MLTNAQEKLIRSLHSKKGRDESGRCLVEGKKVIETAGTAVEFLFGPKDTKQFSKLITTETPQDAAAVARIPKWTLSDVVATKAVVVLDGVQDPGNVGAILRLCLGFRAGLLLVESADVTSPKVVRSSVGALFQVPWVGVSRKDAGATIQSIGYPIYRLENVRGAKKLIPDMLRRPLICIAGSEGEGIRLNSVGVSVVIGHDARLESLNVGHALAIALHAIA